MTENIYFRENYENLTKNISNSNKKCFFIIGEYKQGKTTCINFIEKHMNDRLMPKGYNVRLHLQNDSILDSQDFAPFTHFLLEKENIQSQQRKEVAIAIADSHAVTRLYSKLSQRKYVYASIYNITEASILEKLEKVADKQKLMMYCDDVDKWDKPSIILLKKMIADTSTTWIKNSTFVISASSAHFVDELTNSIDKRVIYNIPKLSQTQVQELVKNTSINATELFELTEGNIGQVLDFIEYCNNSQEKNIFHNLDKKIRNKISEQIMGNDSTTSASVEEETTSTMEIINRSSIVGDHFERQLLQAVSQDDNFAVHLEHILSGEIYTQRASELYFKNTSIYKRFYEQNKSQEKYHYVFAKALQRVIPSDYLRRAEELLLCHSENWQSAIAYFNYAVNFKIKHQTNPMTDGVFVNLLKNNLLYDCLSDLLLAYDDYFAGDFDSSLLKLPHQTRDCTVNLQIDYLKCLILTNKDIYNTDYCDALKILETWLVNKEISQNEPYLWLRLAILYDELSSEVYGTGKYANEIANVFNKYIGTDNTFRIEYFDYLAKNNYTFSADIEYNNSKSALNFFEKETTIANKALLARSMSNHVANAMVMGEYCEAINLSVELLKLITANKNLSNFTVTALNNLCVAYVMSKPSDTDKIGDFINFYKRVMTKIQGDLITTTLIKINYGNCLFLYGSEQEALNLYKELYETVCADKTIGDYYKYFITNNYMLISGYINKTVTTMTFDVLNSMSPCPNNQRYFNIRPSALNNHRTTFLIKENLFKTMGDNNVGKAWSFWGRPLLFTDIQYWTD